jgi:biopolymer transport protein TolR
MAGGLLGAPGASRRPRRGADFAPPMSEINVTPMVDVMLVLLIIFMVAAPMLTTSIPVDLPTSNGNSKPPPAEPITITVAKDGRTFVQDMEVNEQTMIPKVDELAKEGLEQRIYIRGDEGVLYGRMVAVLGALTGRGYHKIGIVSVRARTPSP